MELPQLVELARQSLAIDDLTRAWVKLVAPDRAMAIPGWLWSNGMLRRL